MSPSTWRNNTSWKVWFIPWSGKCSRGSIFADVQSLWLHGLNFHRCAHYALYNYAYNFHINNWKLDPLKTTCYTTESCITLSPFPYDFIVTCSPKRDYVQHPTGKIAILKKCINRVGYSHKQECYITLESDRHPDREVYYDNGHGHCK